jgi:hypothetical protein
MDNSQHKIKREVSNITYNGHCSIILHSIFHILAAKFNIVGLNTHSA